MYTMGIDLASIYTVLFEKSFLYEALKFYL